MLIDEEKFPNIMEAIYLIQEDSGDRLRIPVLKVPDRWDKSLPAIESTIGTLSKKERAPESPPLPAHVKPSELLDSELYTFCNGEFHEQHAIANRSGDLTVAHVFLNDYFEDWTYTDDVKETPKRVCITKRFDFLQEVDQESARGLSDEQRKEMSELMSYTGE